MTLSPQNNGPDESGDQARKIVFGAFVVVLTLFTLLPLLHLIRGHSIKDYRVWYEAGVQVLQRSEVYPDRWHKFPFMYPPPCALLLAPLSALGRGGLILVLALVNAAAWVASIVLSTYLAAPASGRKPLLLYLVPNVIVLAYVWGTFLLGQPSLVLLALMLGAFAALWHKQEKGAGVLIALATAIKAFPLLALIYLLYRRYWVASASLVVTLVFLFLILPLPFRGVDLARQDLQRWTAGMLFKYDETGFGQRTSRSHSWRNQSIWGVANRLLRHVEFDPGYGPHTPVYVNLVDLKFETVNKIIFGTALIFGLAYVLVMPAAGSRTRETDSIEFALLLLLILLFTPMSFGYLFAWLLYPFTVVVQRLRVAMRGPLLSCGIAAVVLLSLSIPLRVPAQAYGNTCFATVLLFIGLAIELVVERRQAGAGLALPPS